MAGALAVEALSAGALSAGALALAVAVEGPAVVCQVGVALKLQFPHALLPDVISPSPATGEATSARQT